MKISKRYLRELIKEQYIGAGSEISSPLLDFARAYSDLGGAIQAQVVEVVEAYNQFGPDSERFEEIVLHQNPNAIQKASDSLTNPLLDLGKSKNDVAQALTTAIELYDREGF